MTTNLHKASLRKSRRPVAHILHTVAAKPASLDVQLLGSFSLLEVTKIKELRSKLRLYFRIPSIMLGMCNSLKSPFEHAEISYYSTVKIVVTQQTGKLSACSMVKSVSI